MDFQRATGIGVPHGFSARAGGCSPPPWDGLNVGLHVGDAPERVQRNLLEIARAAGVAPAALCTVSQVHGDAVVEAPPPQAGDAVPPPCAEADALWTARPGQAVAVKVADCVPVLLWDPSTGRVAAVHAGWRGAIAGLPGKVVAEWGRTGGVPARVRAAVGPCIKACCYEVSADLAARFVAAFGPGAARPSGAAVHLDLVHAVRASLVGAGVPAGAVEVVGGCTACDPRYFSHRRDRGRTGRQLGFILCGPAATGM